MLKNFKLSKRDSHGSKGRLTSADISTPTQTQENSNVIKHMKTVPVRYLSSSDGIGKNQQQQQQQTTNSYHNRHSSNVSSPDKAIKAIYNYHSQTPKELSFVKGEFFYVINENDEWYEASNPSTGKQGMVPKSYFEEFDRTRPTSIGATTATTTNRQSQQTTQSNESSSTTKLGSLYAIVLYDFKAEKSDELTAFVGENLFICAHHNFEWFIAKPIGRLGGPGLVPVGFVSIVDIATGYATGNDVMEDIKSVNLPTVQEWKANIAKYKASNINLGTVEQKQQDSQYRNSNKNMSSSGRDTGTSRKGSVLTANSYDVITRVSVDSYGLEDEKYWFAVNCDLDNGKSRKLKRYYEDFYDLQVSLLDSFPAESGKLRDSNGQWTKRILPYIPGPVPYVTEMITKKRREDLNVYVTDLVKLPAYISHSPLVDNVFKLRNNGYDEEYVTSTVDHPGKDNGDTAILHVNPNDLNNNEDNTLTGEDLKLQEKLSGLALSSTVGKNSRPTSALPSTTKPTKIKFYYKDDIFALMLNKDITFAELHDRIAPRIDTEKFKLCVKLEEGDGEEIKSDLQVPEIIDAKLKISVHDL
ncbi:phosphatidylinositol-3-phosphate-binding protein BEM1 NDAI_0C05470 [Naumovozyma dairenensis CBS 421]|uniref:Bud emergence protein 1 n=1 Tax=Naumovozyma dairenensis (strain ATCC 10597 / BCRC 20456 / CBS 421 / NBRC 0211 / NRRL Y-12639) TaxID=1071378 RepID=G0W8U5_NAUDC|nr:hypothetical protein NDAI_0C05470 [Naumovozyma dairenensis CBS 421]CCD24206.1 hypothetical protein NDAI_0C05470 [Naumovozyma dairenensis CBS 421]